MKLYDIQEIISILFSPVVFLLHYPLADRMMKTSPDKMKPCAMRFLLLVLIAMPALFSIGCAQVAGPVVHEELSAGVAMKIPLVRLDVTEPATVSATVGARGLRVRKGPGTGHRLAGMLYRGDTVVVLEVSANGWCLVKADEGVEGWVWGPFLQMSQGFSAIDREGIRYIRLTEDTLLGPDGFLVVYLRFRPPLEKVVVNDVFGTRRIHPVNGGLGVMHEGMDLRAKEGVPVLAVSDGTVTAVAFHESYGNFIDIAHHDGFSSRYAHLELVLVSEGERVGFGRKIALSGNSGRTTGPHLHFELRKDGVAVDPEDHIVMREIKGKKL